MTKVTAFALAAVLPWAAAVSAQPLPEGHPPLTPATDAQGGDATARSEEELLRELDAMADLATKDKTFEIAHSLGKLYYASGRYPQAVTYLSQAADKGEPARALWLAQAKAAKAKRLDLPTAQEAGCADAEAALDVRVEKAQALAKAGDTGGAATCSRLAVQSVVEARNMLAAAQFHAGDADAALKTAEATLEAAPDDADAVYFHASLLFETRGEDPKALVRAQQGFERFAKLRPMTSQSRWALKLAERAERAAEVGGLSKLPRPVRPSAPNVSGALPPDHPPIGGAAAPTAQAATPSAVPSTAGPARPAPLSAETMQAFANVERTPELMAQLAKTVEEAEGHLAAGRYEDALNGYKQVMPLNPENGRMRAGMAWTLVKLGRQPMAQNVWNVAVRADPSSVDELGKRLQALGDAAGAKGVWSMLSQSDPAYAARANLATRLQ